MLMTLQQNEGLELLREFASKQFCAEHIKFCEAVDKYRTLPEAERNGGAVSCYAHFINPESVDNVRELLFITQIHRLSRDAPHYSRKTNGNL